MSAIPGFWAVIPAGGSGTRLWPISRRQSPKFLHDLTGSGQSLLRATWDRLEPLVGDQMLVVTGVAHEDAVRAQLPMLGHDAVVGEPSPRDSMPAIGLAAAMLERRDPEAVLGSFAADHVIRDTAAFEGAVREAVAVARQGDLVTIGIEPTHPSTGFGYIRLGEPLTVEGAPSAHRVDEFVEKPDADTARRYLDTGEYRWNAGMFVVGATTLLELLAENHADMVDHLRTIAADPRRMRDLWPALQKIAIDHAVAEPAAAAGRVAVVPAALGWDDVGDFAALTQLVTSSSDVPGITAIGPADDILSIDSTATVATGGRLVALIGVDDLVVVDTQDALLITRPERAQDVKKIVEELTARGRTDLT
ncbi:mannose-1-phosphate guanylyltransferase [Intrasporangium flavum]|uniref:mannose-1-phosphate guanylyltransferase n=1 Tax=Intrasporangium flavum TaxID=1428657 RepID=UPI00096CF7AD|nr:mannose-1-phosphate guanylyltransferase [Intrasporangium flavum]